MSFYPKLDDAKPFPDGTTFHEDRNNIVATIPGADLPIGYAPTHPLYQAALSELRKERDA